ALALAHADEDEVPVEPVVGEDQVEEHGGEHGQDRDRHPAPGVPDGHGLDGLGSCPSGLCLRRHCVGQETCGLTAGSVMPPASTPHLERIVLYVPSAINASSAASIAAPNSACAFGRT